MANYVEKEQKCSSGLNLSYCSAMFYLTNLFNYAVIRRLRVQYVRNKIRIEFILDWVWSLVRRHKGSIARNARGKFLLCETVTARPTNPHPSYHDSVCTVSIQLRIKSMRYHLPLISFRNYCFFLSSLTSHTLTIFLYYLHLR